MARSCHTPRDGGARDALKISTELDEREGRAALEQMLDLDLLPEAELEDEVRADRQARWHLAEQPRDRVEPFAAAKQRDIRLVAHLRLQPAAVAIADVGRVGDDEIERSLDAG